MAEPVGTPDTHITEDMVRAGEDAIEDLPADGYRDEPYARTIARAAVTAALAGRTVVELPEPTAWRNRLDGDLDIWPIGGWSVTAGGGTVSISTSTDGLGGGLGGFEADRARAIAAAMLAGAERIERSGGSQVGDQR